MIVETKSAFLRPTTKYTKEKASKVRLHILSAIG